MQISIRRLKCHQLRNIGDDHQITSREIPYLSCKAIASQLNHPSLSNQLVFDHPGEGTVLTLPQVLM